MATPTHPTPSTGTAVGTTAQVAPSAPGAAALELRDVSIAFPVATGTLGRRVPRRVVNQVSLTVAAGEAVGLVGESGSGKSTTARAAMRLLPVESGRVLYGDTDVTDLSDRAMRRHRRRVQMVFQDPYSSLDPGMTIDRVIAEPLVYHTDMSRAERHERARDLIVKVGLTVGHLDRHPYELSGGQRQRIAIARALALDPEVVICDEAVSALDVSTQNQILLLLRQLRDEMGVGYLFIAHDLGVVRQLTDRTIVMYCGEIVEQGPTRDLLSDPAHPYTRSLLSAVPVPSPKRQRERRRIVLRGDAPDPLNPPSGCRFHERCPEVMDICRTVVPAPVTIRDGGTVRCHLYGTATTSEAPQTNNGSGASDAVAGSTR